MMISRRRLLHWVAMVPATPLVAWAHTFPNRPLRWIVGFPPGGGADTVARIMGSWLSQRLGQPVVIENKPGAGSSIAAQTVINSPPDGYTLLFLGASSIVNSKMDKHLHFNVQRDIAPVSGLVDYPMVMVVHPSVPARTVAEFISYAKANPGRISMASFGIGSASHLAGELFRKMAGLDLVHVPYRGSAAMITNLIGGQVQVAFDVITTSAPYIHTGAVRALGVTNVQRYSGLPDVPTIAETLTGYEAGTWAGVGVPRDTPPEIILRLNREINNGLADPAIRSRLNHVGARPVVFTPKQFADYIASEAEKWDRVMISRGIKLN
jgi:tripartite-type tricarboxylate transporter receptor subunit TctC